MLQFLQQSLNWGNSSTRTEDQWAADTSTSEPNTWMKGRIKVFMVSHGLCRKVKTSLFTLNDIDM